MKIEEEWIKRGRMEWRKRIRNEGEGGGEEWKGSGRREKN